MCFFSCFKFKKTYQNLSETYSAIEPPTWALLLAQSTRSAGFNVTILDANAERLNEEEIYIRLKEINPRLIAWLLMDKM